MLCELLEQSRTWLLAHDRDPDRPRHLARFQSWVSRRAQGEPLAYLVGDKEFFGLNLQVSPHVLIPRPDTEILVEWALERLGNPTRQNVLDLGTGSGAIALALQHRCPQAHVTAVDASAGALQTAQHNAQKFELARALPAGFLAATRSGRVV